jgi:hypothetical protein
MAVPVARTEPRRAVAAALAVAVGAVLLVAVVVFLNSRSTPSGDATFGGLDVDTLLENQGEDGVPFCVDDPVDGLRPICVFHTGSDDDTGWVAYDAQVDGCALELARGSSVLVDGCTGTTYPFTGEGLAQYGTSVEEGRLEIDLDGEEAPPETVVESGDVPGP